MLFYNSMLSLPMLLVAVVAKGEPMAMTSYPLLWNPQFQLVLLASSALGLTINHSTFVCTRINEPLMTSVAGARMCCEASAACASLQLSSACTPSALLTVWCFPLLAPCAAHSGNLKNAIMTIVGAFAFGDFIFETWNAAGLAMSMAGAVWYAMRSALKVIAASAAAGLMVSWGIYCCWCCGPTFTTLADATTLASTACMRQQAAAAWCRPTAFSAVRARLPCAQARQKSLKDRLLQQMPVIGRDRLKVRAGLTEQAQLTGAPNGFTASGASTGQLGTILGSHARSESRSDLGLGSSQAQQ